MMRLPHTVVIELAATVPDKYGNTVKDWSLTPASSVTTDGFYQPRSGREDETGQDVQVSDGVLYLPPGTVVTGDHRATVLGLTYEVVGPPEVWDGGAGFSSVANVRAVLRRVTG